MSVYSALPREVLVNTDDKSVPFTTEMEDDFPAARDLFRAVDHGFYDRVAKLEEMERSLFEFYSESERVTSSLLKPGSSDEELLVLFAPFSDGPPQSPAETLYRRIVNDPHDPVSVGEAAPHSWNQITKSSVIADLLAAAGRPMPVLTIFSPIPPGAFTKDQLKQFGNGDFSPAGALALRAATEGLGTEHMPQNVHFHGASLGAANAIAAARFWGEENGAGNESKVRSVTAQELIIAPKHVGELAVRFASKQTVGEPSDAEIEPSLYRIAEPRLRQKIEGAGTEIAMVDEIFRAMLKLSYLRGLTRPERSHTPSNVKTLNERDVHVALPLAENDGLAVDTLEHLPADTFAHVPIRALKDQRIGHIVDEYVAVTALLAVSNILRSPRP